MTGAKLSHAVRQGDAATVRTLLSMRGPQSFMNYQDAFGYTPLHHAAGFGNEAITKQLITGHCQVDLQTKNGWTPLHVAAHQGHEAVTK